MEGAGPRPRPGGQGRGGPASVAADLGSVAGLGDLQLLALGLHLGLEVADLQLERVDLAAEALLLLLLGRGLGSLRVAVLAGRGSDDDCVVRGPGSHRDPPGSRVSSVLVLTHGFLLGRDPDSFRHLLFQLLGRGHAIPAIVRVPGGQQLLGLLQLVEAVPQQLLGGPQLRQLLLQVLEPRDLQRHLLVLGVHVAEALQQLALVLQLVPDLGVGHLPLAQLQLHLLAVILQRLDLLLHHRFRLLHLCQLLNEFANGLHLVLLIIERLLLGEVVLQRPDLLLELVLLQLELLDALLVAVLHPRHDRVSLLDCLRVRRLLLLKIIHLLLEGKFVLEQEADLLDNLVLALGALLQAAGGAPEQLDQLGQEEVVLLLEPRQLLGQVALPGLEISFDGADILVLVLQ